MTVMSTPEEPEAAAFGGFDAVVVTPSATPSPPSRFNTFGPCARNHDMFAILVTEPAQRSVRYARHDIEWFRPTQHFERTI